MTATLSIFNFMTLNGYVAAPNGDTSWHTPGAEEAEYSEASASPDSLLLFGRVTYGHMRAFWPTPRAAELMPRTAHAMNAAEKVVFSRTLEDPGGYPPWPRLPQTLRAARSNGRQCTRSSRSAGGSGTRSP